MKQWRDRRVRCSAWLGRCVSMSADLLPEPGQKILKLSNWVGRHRGRLCAVLKLVGRACAQRAARACIYLLVVVPQSQHPLEAAGADKWLDSKDSLPQQRQRRGVKDLSAAVNVTDAIQLRAQLAQHREEPVLPVAAALPPSDGETNRARDAAADNRPDYGNPAWSVWGQTVLFMFGALLGVGVPIFWDQAGRYWWWRIRERLNDPSSATRRKGGVN